MKAITIRQPWAAFIAFGLKTIETRTNGLYSSLYGTSPIAIHAGKKFDEEWPTKFIGTSHALRVAESIAEMVKDEEMFGVVLATAICRAAKRQNSGHSKWVPYLQQAACCDVFEKWILRLDRVQRIEPVAASGKRGIWEWEPPK